MINVKIINESDAWWLIFGLLCLIFLFLYIYDWKLLNYIYYLWKDFIFLLGKLVRSESIIFSELTGTNVIFLSYNQTKLKINVLFWNILYTPMLIYIYLLMLKLRLNLCLWKIENMSFLFVFSVNKMKKLHRPKTWSFVEKYIFVNKSYQNLYCKVCNKCMS